MDLGSLGYACGVLCGRGCIKRGRNNCVSLRTENRALAEEFASSLRALQTTDVTIRQKTMHNKICFTINVYGKAAVKIFDDIDFSANKKSWSLPGYANNDKEFRTSFLAGFFDATSYVYFNREKYLSRGNGYRYLRATSASADGLDGVKKLLSMEGVPSSLRISQKGPGRLMIRGGWRLKRFLERVPLRTTKKNLLEDAVHVVVDHRFDAKYRFTAHPSAAPAATSTG